jgi:hypothetical protein
MTRDRHANVGVRSQKIAVRLRGDTPCALKRHFKGCLRQVVGYLDMLASRDHERFVWPGWQAIREHTRNYATGKIASRSQVYFWLDIAEQMHILTPARRNRGGCIRDGYIVLDHDAIAMQSRKGCSFSAARLKAELKRRAELSPAKQPLSDAQAPLSEAPAMLTGRNESLTGRNEPLTGRLTGRFDDANRTADRTHNRTEISAESSEEEDVSGNGDAGLAAGLSDGLAGSIPGIPVLSPVVNPVRLRSQQSDGSSSTGEEEGSSEIVGVGGENTLQAGHIEPEQIFTHDHSWLVRFANLRKAAEDDPAFMGVLIETARTLGVPRNWRDALPFTDAVIDQLPKRGQPIPEALHRVGRFLVEFEPGSGDLT